ncbi:hypothetical protein EVG20_g7298 [Dentipellis fragilis]|uniref:Uncharacterized protein n=1 Tax=Dentipellis fragilis TaxID=205917 RepID=A0A4Y9YFY9_9AGAM|nr:hypothetical protein EVG20_g7298 [Dentipellis fragilis]
MQDTQAARTQGLPTCTSLASTAVTTLTTTVASTTSAAALGIGEVDANSPAVELLLVQVVDGGVSLLAGAVGDEAEAAGAASLAIAHDDRLWERKQTSVSECRRQVKMAAPLLRGDQDDDKDKKAHIEDLAKLGESLREGTGSKGMVRISKDKAVWLGCQTDLAQRVIGRIPTQIAIRIIYKTKHLSVAHFPQRAGEARMSENTSQHD